MFRGLTSPFGVVSHCHYHCCARVAQKIRSIQTYRCLHLPPVFTGSPYNVLNPSKEVVSNYRYRSCSLPDLTGHFKHELTAAMHYLSARQVRPSA